MTRLTARAASLAIAAAMAAMPAGLGQQTKLATRRNRPNEVLVPTQPKPVRRSSTPVSVRSQDDIDRLAGAEAKRARRCQASAYRVSRGATRQTATPRIRAYV